STGPGLRGMRAAMARQDDTSTRLRISAGEPYPRTIRTGAETATRAGTQRSPPSPMSLNAGDAMRQEKLRSTWPASLASALAGSARQLKGRPGQALRVT